MPEQHSIHYDTLFLVKINYSIEINFTQNAEKDACLVYCGDFNSCPGSGVYEFMTKQYIEPSCSIWSSSKYYLSKGLDSNH